MSNELATNLVDAKQRLDTLIAHAHDQLLMPITIAEVLRKINDGTANLEDIGYIKRKSTAWCAAVKLRLFRKHLSQNASYKDKLYSGHMPVAALAVLSAENSRTGGIVEAYVYARLRQTVESLRPVRNTINGTGNSSAKSNAMTRTSPDLRFRAPRGTHAA